LGDERRIRGEKTLQATRIPPLPSSGRPERGAGRFYYMARKGFLHGERSGLAKQGGVPARVMPNNRHSRESGNDEGHMDSRGADASAPYTGMTLTYY